VRPQAIRRVRAPAVWDGCRMTLTKSLQIVVLATVALSSIAVGAAGARSAG
jgi:hypothetical protein